MTRLVLLAVAVSLIVIVASVALGVLLMLALGPLPKGDPNCSDVDEHGNWW